MLYLPSGAFVPWSYYRRARHQADGTLNGKKLEVPIKRLLAGAPPERVMSLDALRNPASIEPFVRMARGE